jgi:hypothetical protein
MGRDDGICHDHPAGVRSYIFVCAAGHAAVDREGSIAELSRRRKHRRTEVGPRPAIDWKFALAAMDY